MSKKKQKIIIDEEMSYMSKTGVPAERIERLLEKEGISIDGDSVIYLVKEDFNKKIIDDRVNDFTDEDFDRYNKYFETQYPMNNGIILIFGCSVARDYYETNYFEDSGFFHYPFIDTCKFNKNGRDIELEINDSPDFLM